MVDQLPAPIRRSETRERAVVEAHSKIGLGGPLVEGVRSIAVLRAGGLGDLVFALPALEAVRAAYPDAEIVLLGSAWQAEILCSRQSPVDRLVALPPIRGITARPDEAVDEEPVRDLTRRLQAERFDLAIQLHGGGRHSNPFVRSLGARVTAGLRTPDADALDRSVRYVYYQSETLRALEVVGLVGAAPVALEPRLAVTELDRAEALAALDEAGYAGGGPDSRHGLLGPPLRGAPARHEQPLVVLHPGAGDQRRRWPSASFGRLGDALQDAGVGVAITGSADERPLVRDVASRMRHAPLDLAGRLSMSGLIGLLAEADLVVSNDSGPLHVAMAVGSPTIGIYWCGNLINAGPFGRDRHRPAISWQLACPVCGVDCTVGTCPHRESFVSRVAVAEVLGSALDLLTAAGASRLPELPRVEGAAAAIR